MSALLGALLAAIAVLLAAAAVRPGMLARGARGVSSKRPRGVFMLAVFGRMGRLLPGLVSLLARRQSSTAIARAGLSGRITPKDVAGARAACVLAALTLLPRLASAVPARMLPLVVGVLLWSAAELPLLLLARRGARRATALRAALPDALDLLRACLAAGLPLRRSLALVAAHCAEPVAGEFAQVSAETTYGVPQAEAFARLATRNPEPEVRALVQALRQAEQGGSPLAPLIAAQASDARLALNRAIVERGARAGPKIQLIVSATIVPGALIAFAAIVIAGIVRGELNFF